MWSLANRPLAKCEGIGLWKDYGIVYLGREDVP